MTEKKKRNILIAGAGIVSLALAIGIGLRFSGHATIPSSTELDQVQNTPAPVVDIQTTDPPDAVRPVIHINTSDKISDPGTGAIDTGTEQTIQADPVKPEEPDKPTPPSATTLPGDHDAEDVPKDERKTEDERPPVYEEQPTVTPPPQPESQGGYDEGGSYVPGFGYIPSSGEGTATQDDSIYENGNKVGIMD